MKSSIVETVQALYHHLPLTPEMTTNQMSPAVRYRNASRENRIKWLLTCARYRSRKSGREVEAGLFEHLAANLPNRCPACNVKLRYECTSEHGKSLTDSPSLDRLNNRQGYTIKNTRIICTSCNRLKRNGSLKQFRSIVSYLEREGYNR